MQERPSPNEFDSSVASNSFYLFSRTFNVLRQQSCILCITLHTALLVTYNAHAKCSFSFRLIIQRVWALTLYNADLSNPHLFFSPACSHSISFFWVSSMRLTRDSCKNALRRVYGQCPPMHVCEESNSSSTQSILSTLSVSLTARQWLIFFVPYRSGVEIAFVPCMRRRRHRKRRYLFFIQNVQRTFDALLCILANTLYESYEVQTLSSRLVAVRWNDGNKRCVLTRASCTAVPIRTHHQGLRIHVRIFRSEVREMKSVRVRVFVANIWEESRSTFRFWGLKMPGNMVSLHVEHWLPLDFRL